MARHFGIGFETVWGTPVAPTVFMEALDEDLHTEGRDKEISTIRSWSARQYSRLNSLVLGGARVVGNFQDLAHIFYLLHGSVDTTGVGPYTHTGPASTGIVTPAPKLTLEVQRDSTTKTFRYAGCMLTGINLVVDVDNEMTVRMDFVGKSEATGTAASATFPDFDVVLPKHATVNIDGSDAEALNFNLSIAYDHDQPNALGSTVLVRQPQQSDTVKVTGNFQMYFDDGDMTEYAKFINETVTDIQLACTDGTHSCTINMNKCLLQTPEHGLSGRDRNLLTVNFASYFDATGTESMQTVTVNDKVTVP